MTGGFRRLVLTGIAGTAAAVALTTFAAAVAEAAGVGFVIPGGGGEAIPLSGFAVVTGLFSVVGVVMAAAFLRWSAHPARRFLVTSVALTMISLVPPLISGASAGTVTVLIVLHLVAAAVMIPALTKVLSAGSGSGASPAPAARPA
ncbi:DUF6069 family protein [Actinoplanes sp. OR16]|uniref:DUF6069 family protein n=1 Tax=Actinoplanes sp. OR16 TaxID=946334 RepID=UPI001E32DDBB|nr:DUF6069 family protein [Actinoplanes sp. OR16]